MGRKRRIKKLLNETLSMGDMPNKLQKVADELQDSDGIHGVVIIAIGGVGSVSVTSFDKNELRNRDVVRMAKQQVKRIETGLEIEDEDEADRLFDKLQAAADALDDQSVLTKTMGEVAFDVYAKRTSAVDGLKKINKILGNVLTDSELIALDKSMKDRHKGKEHEG